MEAALLIEADGTVLALHTDLIPLTALGRARVKRASRVEFNESLQLWQVKRPGSGKVLYSHPSRAACLTWEQRAFGQTRHLRAFRANTNTQHETSHQKLH